MHRTTHLGDLLRKREAVMKHVKVRSQVTVRKEVASHQLKSSFLFFLSRNTSLFLPGGNSSSHPVVWFLVSCESGLWWWRCRTPARRWREWRASTVAADGTVSLGDPASAKPDLVWTAVFQRYRKSSAPLWWSSSSPLQMLWLVETVEVVQSKICCWMEWLKLNTVFLVGGTL